MNKLVEPKPIALVIIFDLIQRPHNEIMTHLAVSIKRRLVGGGRLSTMKLGYAIVEKSSSCVGELEEVDIIVEVESR